MWLLRIGFLACLAFLGALAMFLGALVVLTSLQNGAISWTYTLNGRSITETVTRATDATGFWTRFAQMGGLPLVLGLAALAFSLRRLKRG